MSHLILEAKWGSQDWDLLGIADKNDIDKINRLYELHDDWNNAYTNNRRIEFRIREVSVETR